MRSSTADTKASTGATRRDLLRLGTGFAAALLTGIALPVAHGVGRGLRRSLRAPADLMARIRHRTRPFDPASLDKPHELAG